MRWCCQPGVIRCVLTCALAPTIALAACNRGGHRVLEVAYVSAPQAILRDQVAAAFNKIGTVKNGERVEVLEHEKRFSRVRTPSGLEGWVEQRYLVDQKTYDAVQKLTQDNQDDPVQASGTLRNDTNLHTTPGRDSEHLYQLTQGAKVALLKRAAAEKQPMPVVTATPTTAVKPGTTRLGTRKESARVSTPALEDWWLARDSGGRVGWVLARMVDVDVPIEIGQYAEGQRFVAFFVLNQVQDGPSSGAKAEDAKKVSQYLAVLTEPHDGLPYDFDQVRVFTWNTRKHRYETAYREHKLAGVLPVIVRTEDFDKEGTLPVFVLRVKDDSGNVSERKYKLNTPIVRRVLAPGEEPAHTVAKRRRR